MSEGSNKDIDEVTFVLWNFIKMKEKEVWYWDRGVFTIQTLCIKSYKSGSTEPPKGNVVRIKFLGLIMYNV